MRKTIYSVFMITLILTCSILFTSCSAITAQNIKNPGSVQAMNGGAQMGGQGKNGNPGMGGPGNGGGNFRRGEMNANLMGKIVSVDGNSIKIDVAEQKQSDKTSSPNNSKQPRGGFLENKVEMKYTGTQKTLIVNDNVKISQGANMSGKNKNKNLKLNMKVSDLKKGQVIMIWYKGKSNTVERISVVKL